MEQEEQLVIMMLAAELEILEVLVQMVEQEIPLQVQRLEKQEQVDY